ncbi:MAG TPA: dihydropteroate synthase [Clostridia bacterium]|nr:dihydropteroate synthase [Clostridia bacterium]
MVIIGEKLNSSIPKTYNAFIDNDTEYIIGLIKAQEAAGAEYLDINTALSGDELSKMEKVVRLVLEHSSCGIMLDSTSPDVVVKTLPLIKNRKVIINSVTLAERIDAIIPVAVQYNAGVVALPIGRYGMPKNASQRAENAFQLIEILTSNNIPKNNIYIDILAEALATNQSSAVEAINAIGLIKERYPNIHIICGLSNVSYGLPKRININAAFLSAAVFAGLDTVIMDITSPAIKQILYAALAVAGKDEYCMDYLEAIRESK